MKNDAGKTLEALCEYAPILADLTQGANTAVMVINPDWSKGKPASLRDVLERLGKGESLRLSFYVRKGMSCGDFDSEAGMENAQRAADALKRLGAIAEPIESGRPGHAHLWVKRCGLDVETVSQILKNHGADVRDDKNRQRIRLPETPNRNGQRSTTDRKRFLERFSADFTPNFREPIKDTGRAHGMDRSAEIHSMALTCIRAGLSLTQAFALIEATEAGSKLREQANPFEYLKRSWIKALSQLEPKRPTTDPREAIQRLILETLPLVRSRIREQFPRRADQLISTWYALTAKSKQLGRNEFGFSVREMAEICDVEPSTVSRYLQILTSLGLLQVCRQNNGGWAKRYRIVWMTKSEDNATVKEPGSPEGVCPYGLLQYVHFRGDDERDAFHRRPAMGKVAAVIMQATEQGLSVTPSDVAGIMGKSVASVRPHLRALERYGLIVRNGRRYVMSPDADFKGVARARGHEGRQHRRRICHRVRREGFLNYLEARGVPDSLLPVPRINPRARTQNPYLLRETSPRELPASRPPEIMPKRLSEVEPGELSMPRWKDFMLR